MLEIPSTIEELVFGVLEQCRFLFFPEQWNSVYSDFTKNEAFILLFVYRRQQANMTEIAEYMNIPLNTVTGVVGRLEKKCLVLRQRNTEDKRVVTVHPTETGMQFIREQIRFMGRYFNRIMDALTDEEKKLILRTVDKIILCVHEENSQNKEKTEQKSRIRQIHIE